MIGRSRRGAMRRVRHSRGRLPAKLVRRVTLSHCQVTVSCHGDVPQQRQRLPVKRYSLPMLPLLGALVIVTFATPAHATLNACAAAKKKCVRKKAAALLKCHSKNEKPPGLTPAKF